MLEIKTNTFERVAVEDLAKINGGATYYGNGVYCNKKKCWVEWGQAGSCIGQTVVGGWLGGAVPGKC